jgi:hypothetical protein
VKESSFFSLLTEQQDVQFRRIQIQFRHAMKLNMRLDLNSVKKFAVTFFFARLIVNKQTTK